MLHRMAHRRFTRIPEPAAAPPPEPKPEPKPVFPWTRSETLALAQQSCAYCLGLGLRDGRNGTRTVCNCVLRTIFRTCYARFRECAMKEKYISRVSLEANPGRTRKSMWGLKNEEFIADFCLVAKRALSELEHRIFRFHFLLGADWKACCQKLGMERGVFFHHVYRIEQKLGRAFRTLEPYSLFPVDEYFHGTRRNGEPGNWLDSAFPAEDAPEAEETPALKFPLKATAA